MGCKGVASERRWCAEASLISECITGIRQELEKLLPSPIPLSVLWFELWSRLWACWIASGGINEDVFPECAQNCAPVPNGYQDWTGVSLQEKGLSVHVAFFLEFLFRCALIVFPTNVELGHEKLVFSC